MGERKREEGREREDGREREEGERVGNTVEVIPYSTQEYISTHSDNPASTEILTIES